MTASRYLVTLHPSHSLRVLASTTTNLDVTDDAMLRETLESLVTGLKGHLHLDLAKFRIRVRQISRSGAPSTIRAWCGVTPAGRTAVTR